MGAFYFIFGEQAVRTYEDKDSTLKDVAEELENGGGILSNLQPGDHPGEILSEFDGWHEWISIEEDEYRELNELIDKLRVKREKKLNIVLLVSSGLGVYMPQKFLEMYPEKFSEEQKEIIAGDPYEVEGYWDVWQEILDFATVTDAEGTKYYLHQEEDLWAVPVGYDFEDFTE